MTHPDVLLVIPAFNERESLPRTLDELRRVAPAYDVLIVDDGSRDGTDEIAKAHGVPVARHPFNLGVGGALQTGFRYAVAHGYALAVQFDADGQHDPASLVAVIEPVRTGACDVCIGSRFVAPGDYRAPWMRRIGMRLFSAVVRLAGAYRITDTTSGLRAYASSVMQRCQFEFPKDFPDAPLLIALSRAGFRILEVPVHMRARTAGESIYTFGKSLYYPYKNLLASLMAIIQRPI